MTGTAFAVGLALVAGVAGSVQVAVMGRFGERYGTWEALAANLLFSTLVAMVLLVAVRRGSVASFVDVVHAPWWYWAGGGLMGVIVVATITIVSPRLGTTATIALLIAGQLTMGVLIDKFGLFGFDRIEIAWPRVLGVLLLAIGAALSLYKR
jgi:transporter family-2 protein